MNRLNIKDKHLKVVVFYWLCCKRCFFIVFLLWGGITDCYSSRPFLFNNAYVASLGFVGSSTESYLNPASLSMHPCHEISFSYENKYQMSELSNYTLVYQQPLKSVDFSLLTGYQGYADFYEFTGSLSVSKRLKNGLSMGVRLLYYCMDYIDSQGTVSAVTGDVGLQYQFVDNLLVGVLLTNPFRVSIREEGSLYYLPVAMQFGVKYLYSPDCIIVCEVQKENLFPASLRAGIAYRPFTTIELRAGVLSSPFMPSMGVGLLLHHIRINIASTYHARLGFSPVIDFVYSFR